jgi:hypothetical protein
MVDPVPPTRDQLRRVIGGDERFLIALERLFQVSGGETPDNLLALTRRVNGLEQVPLSTDAAILETLKDTIRGLSSEFFVFVSSKYDFPAASGGVIDLGESTTYYVITNVDLGGDRIVSGEGTVIIGTSSEGASIYSTGLTGAPLITSECNFAASDITFKADEVLDLDGITNPGSNVFLDGVSIEDASTIGTIKDYDSVICRSGGFRNSAGLTFAGTFGTISFNEYFLDSPSTGTVITVPSTVTITRRFRATYSAFLIDASATALNVSTSATIPVESYILDTCNFTGGGTYISGVQNNDNKALFVNNVGIDNSANVSNYYMTSNATSTTIGTTGVAVKIAGTTTSSAVTQRFTNTTTNRATYTGAIERTFKIDAIASVGGSANRNFSVYVAVNGTVQASSRSRSKTNSGGDPALVFSSVITSLSQNDYIEAWVANDDNTASLTVVDLNVLVGII